MNKFSFDIKTSIDFFKWLTEDHTVFLQDKTSSKSALNCALKAWHISEWIYGEYKSHFSTTLSSLRQYQDDMKSKCPSLEIMQDISNGTKHFTVTRYTPAVKDTKSQGTFGDSFSSSFDISVLTIKLTDGTTLLFEDEIEKVMKYWDSYFSTELANLQSVP